jgi:hypothetical protein
MEILHKTAEHSSQKMKKRFSNISEFSSGASEDSRAPRLSKQQKYRRGRILDRSRKKSSTMSYETQELRKWNAQYGNQEKYSSDESQNMSNIGS